MSKKTIWVYAGDKRKIPVPTGVCVGGPCGRYFPTEAGKSVEVFAEHRFVRRSMRKVKHGPDRSKKAKQPIPDLLEGKANASRTAASRKPNTTPAPPARAAEPKE